MDPDENTTNPSSLDNPALISNLCSKIDQIEKNQQLSSQFVSELIKNLNDKIENIQDLGDKMDQYKIGKKHA